MGILEELRVLKTWVGDWMKMSDAKKKRRKVCVRVVQCFQGSVLDIPVFFSIFSINHLTEREHQVS